MFGSLLTKLGDALLLSEAEGIRDVKAFERSVESAARSVVLNMGGNPEDSDFVRCEVVSAEKGAPSARLVVSDSELVKELAPSAGMNGMSREVSGTSDVNSILRSRLSILPFSKEVDVPEGNMWFDIPKSVCAPVHYAALRDELAVYAVKCCLRALGLPYTHATLRPIVLVSHETRVCCRVTEKSLIEKQLVTKMRDLNRMFFGRGLTHSSFRGMSFDGVSLVIDTRVDGGRRRQLRSSSYLLREGEPFDIKNPNVPEKGPIKSVTGVMYSIPSFANRHLWRILSNFSQDRRFYRTPAMEAVLNRVVRSDCKIYDAFAWYLAKIIETCGFPDESTDIRNTAGVALGMLVAEAARRDRSVDIDEFQRSNEVW